MLTKVKCRLEELTTTLISHSRSRVNKQLQSNGSCNAVTLAIFQQQVLTWAISSDELIILALLFKWVTTESTARLIPRRRSMAFIPAATDLQPSEKMARVSTVAAVVPVKPKVIKVNTGQQLKVRFDKVLDFQLK
jgi:uncharacterized protein YhbP (UPF0306 family)